MATTSTQPVTPVTPAPATPVSKGWVIFLDVMKYALPVGAAIASIWLHNQSTVAKIGTTVGTIEAGLGATQQ